MKTKMFTLLLAVIASIGTVFAESGTCGENLTWDLTDGLLTISGTGEMANNYISEGEQPWYGHRESIKSVIIEDGVTSIGNNAFWLTSLTSVTIPNSVKTIGQSAFQQCNGLLSIVIPDGVTNIGNIAFHACRNLNSVTIGSGVTNIDHRAFFLCDKLTSITCKAVTPPTLESYVFDGVPKSIPLYVPAESVDTYKAADQWKEFDVQAIKCVTASGSCGDNLTWELSCDGVLTISGTGEMTATPWLSDYSEQINTVIIAYGVTSIGASAFSGCSSLASVTIPNSVTKIGKFAFSYCTSLSSLTIPASVTQIEGHFNSQVSDSHYNIIMGSNNITHLSVEDGNSIYDSRDNCNAIIETATNTLLVGCQNTVIPNTITRIGYCAFYQCATLTSIDIPSSVTNIGAAAFSETGLTNVILPHNVTIECASPYAYYYFGAFGACRELTSVEFADGEGGSVSIGNNTFSDCDKLSSITLSNNVTNIGNYAFLRCSGLTNIIIPGSVTSIGTGAFSDCTGLTSMTCEAVNHPTLESSVFSNVNCSQIPLYVPAESVDAYKAADQWKEFNIQAIGGGTTPTTVIITNGENRDLSDIDQGGTKFIEEIIIEPGGELNVDDADIHIGTLVIEADGTNSGQVHHGVGGVNADHIYLEYILNPCGELASPDRWYAISVPFEVEIATGISRTCDSKTLVSGTDFLIKEYNGTWRAFLGKGWSDKTEGSLSAGQFYMIGIDGNCNRWRFEKKAGQPYEGSTHVGYDEYASSNPLDKGWNGLGNTMLEYMRLNMGLSGISYAVTYDNCYGRFVTSLIADINLCVGRPFFIQASSSGFFDFFFGNGLNDMPAHRAPAQGTTPLMHFTLADETQTTGIDHMFLTMHEDATPDYTIGRDVARMTKDCKTAAQLWCTMSNGTELSAHGVAMPETETIVPLTLFAPTAGEYLLDMSCRAMNGYEVELLHNGVWVATFEAQPVTLDLNAGNNSDYSLRISRHNIPEGIENITPSSVNGEKRIIDGVLYIFHNGHMYDAHGKQVK